MREKSTFDGIFALIGVLFGLWALWAMAVLGSRFTVWMGTKAQLWPF